MQHCLFLHHCIPAFCPPRDFSLKCAGSFPPLISGLAGRFAFFRRGGMSVQIWALGGFAYYLSSPRTVISINETSLCRKGCPMEKSQVVPDEAIPTHAEPQAWGNCTSRLGHITGHSDLTRCSIR